MADFNDFLSALLVPGAEEVVQELEVPEELESTSPKIKDDVPQGNSPPPPSASATETLHPVSTAYTTAKQITSETTPVPDSAELKSPASNVEAPAAAESCTDDGLLAKAKIEPTEQARNESDEDHEQQKPTNRSEDVTGKEQGNQNKNTEIDKFKQSRRDMPVCFKNTFDDDFVHNRKKFGLRICSVIAFDVLKLGDRVMHRNDSTSAVFPTMKRIVVSKQNIKEMHKLEAEKRTYYRKKLNRILKRERANIKRPKGKANDDKKLSKLYSRDDEQSFHKRTHHEASHKASRPAEKFSAGGTRILPFERRYNDSNQQIKRPKLNETAELKTSRALTGKQTHQKKENIKQPRKPLPGSFRIPKKAETPDWYPQKHQPIASTPSPLASSFAPRQKPHFERYRSKNTQFRPRFDSNLKSQTKNFTSNFKIGTFGQNQDQESSEQSCGDESVRTPPPPISEVEFGPLVEGVTKLLETKSHELDHPPKDVTTDLLAHKCAWWFRTMEKDPASAEIACPELHDQICQPSINSNDDDSFVGNVSDPGDDEADCQVNEVSSTENRDPAITDEFCGCALISVKAQFRIQQERENEVCFRHIFQVQEGTNYEKENFKAHCNICDELVPGKKQLGPHIRSSKHVQNLKNLSLQIMSAVEKRDAVKTLTLSEGAVRKRSRSPTDKPKNKPKSKPREKSPLVDKSWDKRKPSRRSRSRSPRRRERDGVRRSPKHDHSGRKPRSRSRDPVAEFLARTSRSRTSRSRSPHKGRRGSPKRSRSPKLFVKRDSNEMFHEKLTLTSMGKWSPDLERRWTILEKEEDALLRKFEARRKKLEETPESHPSYAAEWSDFWQKKYQEVQARGMNPEDYDYVPEWKDFWSARGKLLLQIEFNADIDALRLKYGIDLSVLRKLSRTGEAQPDCIPMTPRTPLAIEPPVYPPSLPPAPVSLSHVREDLSAKSMSISDNGMDEPSPKEKFPVTVNDIKSTWESLTGQRISEKVQKLPSDSDSSKTAESSKLEFDGFDLVQVLQLVSGMQDQLGSLSARVSDFHRKAEGLELEKRRHSYSLLQSRKFISLLLQCKYRFTELVASDDLPRQTLQTLKLCVHLLSLILESATCRGLVSLCSTQPIDKLFQSEGPMPRALVPRTAEVISSTEKRAVAKLLSSHFTNLGKNACTEGELEQMVYKVIHSIYKDNSSGSTSEHRVSTSGNAVSQIVSEPSYDPGDRVVGTALPPLPTISVRAVPPPPRRTYIGGDYYSRR